MTYRQIKSPRLATLIVVLLTGLSGALLLPASAADSALDSLATNTSWDVYKSETCGCCNNWIEHMNAHGFESKIHHPTDLDGVKAELGVLPQWQSCHTAVSAQGYLFEGHVPARYIEQFLAAPPEGALGLAVPGMPMGSPGMEMGGRFTPYDVLQMNKDGTSKIYASIANPDQQ